MAGRIRRAPAAFGHPFDGILKALGRHGFRFLHEAA
jgi:hypothetical protein